MNEFAHLNSTSFLIFGRIFVGPQGETGPLTTIDREWDGTNDGRPIGGLAQAPSSGRARALVSGNRHAGLPPARLSTMEVVEAREA